MKKLTTVALIAALCAASLPSSQAGQTHFTTLYTFTDGVPDGLALINGKLYGVGATTGCGSVFKLQPPASSGAGWTLDILYTFADSKDGCAPGLAPVPGADGSLYGFTTVGGTYDSGVLYKLQPPASPGDAWTGSVAYNFGQGTPGGSPASALLGGPDGSFYLLGNSGDTLVQLFPPPGSGYPWGAAALYTGLEANYLIQGPDGSFYGTAEYAGDHQAGDVFQLTPPSAPGGAWTYTVLHSFGCCDAHPDNPNSLTLSSNGTLYGTTYGSDSTGIYGLGSVFELKPPASPGAEWRYRCLWHFGHLHPNTPLLISNGNLYGGVQTRAGGFVFRLAPPSIPGGDWTITYLHNFTNGQVPWSQMVMDKDGILFGETFYPSQGPETGGTIFAITPQ